MTRRELSGLEFHFRGSTVPSLKSKMASAPKPFLEALKVPQAAPGCFIKGFPLFQRNVWLRTLKSHKCQMCSPTLSLDVKREHCRCKDRVLWGNQFLPLGECFQNQNWRKNSTTMLQTLEMDSFSCRMPGSSTPRAVTPGWRKWEWTRTAAPPRRWPFQ